MTLKQKAIIISIGTTAIASLLFIAVVYWIITVQFQQVENQRVERNIRRITAIINDRFSQINTKLADWTIWDDTYLFLRDKNKAYIASNLAFESFSTIDIDEALFIDSKGALVASIDTVEVSNKESNFPNDLYINFATGSALSKIKTGTDHNQGLLSTDDGILFFVVREVFKSNGTGDPTGIVVFARYFDDRILNSLKDLTQFDAQIILWNDPKMPSDYQTVKQSYQKNKNSIVKILDNNTISGYVIIEDVFGKPQAIIRSDIFRDITLQGKSTMYLLMWLLVGAGVLMAGVNYWLLTGGVLRKISLMASDVDSLAKSGVAIERLKIGSSTDEVDILRLEINNMLESLQKSNSELSVEIQRGESLIDLVNAFVITIDTKGIVKTINQKGAEMLGYKMEEIIGKNWINTFVAPSSQKEVSDRFLELIEGKVEENSHIDNEVITKDGKILMISWHNTLIKDQNGKAISTLSLGEDVTLEKQEEIKKETYAKELERLNELMVNREIKMIALKKELANIKKI